MKAVNQKMKSQDYKDSGAFKLDKMLRGKFTEAVEVKLFTPVFGDHTAFREFRRSQIIDYHIDLMFEQEAIKFFHEDNSYEQVEIIETAEGNCLCIPPLCTVAEFMEVFDSLQLK